MSDRAEVCPHPQEACSFCGSLPGEPCCAGTLFMCGPSKCEHDYTGWIEYQTPEGCHVGSTVCSKCGAVAAEEAYWSDF